MARYIDSKYARGPSRWKRAADNSIANPNSWAAGLYFDRVAVARKLVTDTAKKNTDLNVRAPWAFMHRVNMWPALGPVQFKRAYSTCSLFCMAMQAQLVGPHGRVGTDNIDALLAGTDWLRLEPLDTATLVRSVRCQVCATDVKPT
jgi:hypothetical protein